MRYLVDDVGAAVAFSTDQLLHSGTDGSVRAALERKSLENLASTLADGTLAFQMQRLSELPSLSLSSEGTRRRTSWST